MTNEQIWNYSTLQDGVIERNIYIKSKKPGRPLRIAHLTDLHFNFCNQADIEENDPILMSTYKNREWLKNGSSVDNAKRTLEHVKNFDAIVITGDILDYLSHGCEELANEHIFKVYPNVIASLGNHEAARKVQGEFPEAMSYSKKEEWLKSFWPNDIFYSSKVIDERVMLIQIDNCSEKVGFRQEQIIPFINDIQKAKENDYIVLLFFHFHISPQSEKYSSVKADKIGDSSWAILDLNRHGIKDSHGEASAKICEIIKSNADVIKGCFCGHLHSDFYCELNTDTDKAIPQYILIGTPYDKGHLLNIIIE